MSGVLCSGCGAALSRDEKSCSNLRGDFSAHEKTAVTTMTLDREKIARWLWLHDGFGEKAWDTGAGVIGCTRDAGGGMQRAKRPMDELREVYRTRRRTS